MLGILGLIGGCAGERQSPLAGAANRAETRDSIERSLPASVTDRPGWTTDISSAFKALDIAPTHENICAVVAVIEQESGFRVDPVVPGLAAIAWREIDTRAAHARIPRAIVHGVLALESPTGRSYGERIDRARTEKELSDVYEDLIGAVPLGRTLFADRNPIRTRGPMQVHVAFAEQFAAAKPYPYPVATSIADEVFTRRGGVYFGVAHLLDYRAPYDRYLYRFADFNAGQYASRNAAFQRAVSIASGRPLVADGALLAHDGTSQSPGATERAVRVLRARLQAGDEDIHRALDRAKSPELEDDPIYRRVFVLAESAEHRILPRATVPSIELHGPKITRRLTTQWYASRVNERYERCLNRSR